MKKLLQLLEEDCTLTREQLASMSGMTVEEVEKSVRMYEEEKIVLGYKAIVDWDRTDREAVTALIEVKVTPQRGAVSYTHLDVYKRQGPGWGCPAPGPGRDRSAPP